MKKLLLLLVVLTGLSYCLPYTVYAQGVGINSSGNAADASAILDASSTNKGALIPRLNTLQRDAITSPAQGLLIYNTDCNTINFWNGGAWIAMNYNPQISGPWSVNGTNTACGNTTGVVYSTNAVSNVTGYNWSVPPGSNIVSGQGTTSITVNFGVTSGNVCVSASNDCGTSSPSCLAVNITPSLPGAPVTTLPGNITSSSFIATWATVANASTYYLDVATDAAFNSMVSGYNNVNVGSATYYTVSGLSFPTGCFGSPSYYYRVRAENGCGSGVSSNTMTVSNMASLWVQTESFSTRYAEVQALAIDGSGVYLGGWDRSISNSNDQWRTEKRNLSTGSLIWSQASNPTSNTDRIMAIAVDGSGVYLAGYDNWSNTRWRIEKRDLNSGVLISGFGTGGVITEDPSTDQDQILAIAVNGSALYVAGYDHNTGNGHVEWRIEKRDLSTGALSSGFGSGGIITEDLSPYGDGNKIYALTIDASGLYIGGLDLSPAIIYEWRIEKRDLNTGTFISSFGSGGVVKELITPNDNNFLNALACDASGLYVGGYITNTPQGVLAKLDITTGNLIWSQLENPNDNASFNTLAVDATGLYASGYDQATGSTEARTEKRDLTTGALVWLNTKSTSSSNIIFGTAIDASGVYVAGFDQPSGYGQWRVEKYCKGP